MSVLRKLPLTSGVLFVVFALCATMSHKNLELSHLSDLESMDAIEELLRKVQFVLEAKLGSKVRQGAVPDDDEEEKDAVADPNGCSCSGLQCSCCHTIVMRRFGFRQDGCLKMDYVPSMRTIEASLTVGSMTLFRRGIPATVPQPVCVRYTKISRSLSVCIEFRNFVAEEKFFSGCSKCVISFKGWTLLRVDLGCFRFESPSATFPYLKEGDAQVNDPQPASLGEVQIDNFKPGDDENK